MNQEEQCAPFDYGQGVAQYGRQFLDEVGAVACGLQLFKNSNNYVVIDARGVNLVALVSSGRWRRSVVGKRAGQLVRVGRQRRASKRRRSWRG